MNNPSSRLAVLSLAVIGLVGLSSRAHAANVGYGSCDTNEAAAIIAAGHTPVPVSAPSTTVLASLDVLMWGECQSVGSAPDIAQAVANGMVLIVHDWGVYQGPQLPGGAGIVNTYGPTADLEVPSDSPIRSGPGGSLDNTSLDGGSWSAHGYTRRDSLPVGSIVLVTEADPSQVVTFSYPYGQGRVVYSTTPLGYYFYGGGNPVVRANFANVYTPNLVAWAAGPTFTSCAAEGFRGSKLTLCHQVCEMNYSGAKLNALITAWTRLYREDPPCAR